MNDDLMRRISDALDAPGGLEADEDLRARIDDDPAAKAYARDLGSIGAALEALGERAPEPDWQAMLGRIEARLDEEIEDIGDVTAPPVLEGGEAEVPPVRARASAPVVARPSESKVVELDARRRQRALFATIGGLAAAAAVGLGIMAGLNIERDAELMAAAGVMEAAGEAAPAPPAPAQTAASERMADMEMPPAEDIAEGGSPGALGAAVSPGALGAAVSTPAPTEPRADMAPARGSRATTAGAPRREPADDDWSGALGRGGATGGGGLGATAPGSGGGVAAADRASPDRVEVVNALDGVLAEIVDCMGETRAVARVHVRVNGSTGRVDTVRVSPPFAGAEAACMVRALRLVRMPRSPSPSYEIAHVYRPERVAGGSLGRPTSAARARHRRAAVPRASPAPAAPAADVADAFE